MRILRDEKGSTAVYMAMLAAVAVGAGTVTIDYARLELLRNEMQNHADAAAMAGVTHLDGRTGARARATTVAQGAISNASQMLSLSGSSAPLTVSSITFYSDYATQTLATSDLDAKTIRVDLSPQTASIAFSPVLALTSGSSPSSVTLNARAVAQTRPYICHAPPLMMCDLSEADPNEDPTLVANIGRQVRLKEPQGGNAAWVPGNFGLLALPDGSSGAQAIEGALAAVQPQDCYQIDVLTATGSKTTKVKDGINARFDISPLTSPPAPNVINYLRDSDLIADPNLRLGSGNWDLDGYWTAKHGSVAPGELAGASRYQAYLYELGETFARNGKQTVHPVPAGGPPAGFTTITPPGAAIPVDAANPNLPDFDGVPQNAPAPNGPARRLMEVALLQCIADNIHGSGTYPTYGKYVEMFITQEVRDPPNAAIYGEIVRSITSLNDPEYHSNATLID